MKNNCPCKSQRRKKLSFNSTLIVSSFFFKQFSQFIVYTRVSTSIRTLFFVAVLIGWETQSAAGRIRIHQASDSLKTPTRACDYAEGTSNERDCQSAPGRKEKKQRKKRLESSTHLRRLATRRVRGAQQGWLCNTALLHVYPSCLPKKVVIGPALSGLSWMSCAVTAAIKLCTE